MLTFDKTLGEDTWGERLLMVLVIAVIIIFFIIALPAVFKLLLAQRKRIIDGHPASMKRYQNATQEGSRNSREAIVRIFSLVFKQRRMPGFMKFGTRMSKARQGW